MDGDVFWKVSKLGRDAAEGVARGIQEESWDPFLARKCLDKLVLAADGIASLAPLESVLAGLREAPLLAGIRAEEALDCIREAALAPGCTILDPDLCKIAECSVLRGEFALRPILDRFCSRMLDRAILTGRGGFLEKYGPALLDQARTLLAPVAALAAEVLEARPTAKRLGLARPLAKISADTDLLGGR